MADKTAGAPDAGTIDWGDISRRLQASREALQGARRTTREEKQRLLRSRARDLARCEEDRYGTGAPANAVEFLLAHERYAIQFSEIREACCVKDIVPLPGAPAFVTGIANVRGRILSVIDLKKFFDLPGKGLGDMNRLIILGSGSVEFGILADALVGIRALNVDKLQAAPPTLTGIRQEYLLGVTPDGLIVLDAAKMLSDRRIVVHEEV